VLFDLRSPRRRAAIKVIYSMLAILMAGGLLLFGIGGSGQGILDSLGIGGGSSAGAGFQDQIDAAQKKLDQNPRNQQALLDLVTLNIEAGNAQYEGTDQRTGFPVVGSATEESFNKAADAWAQYLKLKPKKPDFGAAIQLSGAFFVLAVNGQTAADARTAMITAADAQRVAAEANPTVGNLRSLVQYAYLAGQFKQAEAATRELLAKVPAKNRKAIQKQVDQIRKTAEQFQKQVEQEAKAGAQSGANPLGQGSGSSSLGAGSSGALSGP
jgi:hypothetical protein